MNAVVFVVAVVVASGRETFGASKKLVYGAHKNGLLITPKMEGRGQLAGAYASYNVP